MVVFFNLKYFTVIQIFYEQNSFSFSHMPKSFWTAIYLKSGDVYDYGTKDYLISQCEKENLKYKVIRIHKDGSKSIIKSNSNECNISNGEI